MAVDYSVVHITQQLAPNTDTLVLCFSIVGLFCFLKKKACVIKTMFKWSCTSGPCAISHYRNSKMKWSVKHACRRGRTKVLLESSQWCLSLCCLESHVLLDHREELLKRAGRSWRELQFSRAISVIITLECWLMSRKLGHFVVASRWGLVGHSGSEDHRDVLEQ